jgi:O-antigen/teichoic acid export membrane protein
MLIKDIKRISKNSLGFSVGTILTQAIGFFLIPIYTRYLTPDDYGILALAAAVGSILSIFYILGLNGALTRFYYDYNHDKKELKEYVGTITISVIGISFIFTLLLSLFGEPLFAMLIKDVPFNPYILLVLWTVFFGTLLDFPLGLYQVRERSFTYSFLNVLRFIILVSLILYFVVVLKEGALGSLKGGFFSALIFFIIACFLLKKDLSFKIKIKKLKESLHFGLPLIPHALAGWILTLMDRIFLNHYTTLAVVGIYSLGYQIGMVMSLITTSINMAWAPFFMSTAKEKGEETKNIFSRLTTYYMVGILFIGLAISLFAKDIIFLMATPKYYDSYKIIPIIVGTYVLNGMYYMVANQIFYTKKTKYLPFATFGSALLNILFNYLWIPNYGMMGAAWATLVSFAFAFLFTYIISQKVYPIKYEYLMICKVLALAGVICALSIVFSYDNLFYDIATKSLVLLLYPLGLFVMGVFTKSELKVVWQYLHTKSK